MAPKKKATKKPAKISAIAVYPATQIERESITQAAAIERLSVSSYMLRLHERACNPSWDK